MSNLKNLSSKIVDDASIKAEAMLKEAKDNGTSIIASKVKSAKALELQMLGKAKIEASTAKQRIISSTKLTVRNEKLVAMQEIIDKVFQGALEVLLVINEKQYLELLKSYLLSMPIAGNEELVIPTKFRSTFNDDQLAELNAALKASGKIGEMKLSSGERNVNSGFIVMKKGIEINNTFENLVNSLRDELEAEIVKELFN